MKNRSTVAVFILVFLLNLLQLSAVAQTEKTIIEEMFKALGGKEVLSGIKDTRMSGTLELIQYGMSGSLTMYLKEPNKFRMDIEVMGMTITTVYDGEKAIGTNPQTGEIMELPPDQAKLFSRQGLGFQSILYPEKFGITYVYRGVEEIDGKKYYVLEQKFQDGDVITNYLDASTYLTYKTKVKALSPSGAEVESETIYSDYKMVNGVMTAFSMTQYQAGVESGRITFNEVVYNSGLDDALFVLK